MSGMLMQKGIFSCSQAALWMGLSICPCNLPGYWIGCWMKSSKMKTYDKRENYKFEIVNHPDLSGNIPHGAAYGVYTSQVIRYAEVFNRAEDFKGKVKLLTNPLKKNSPSIASNTPWRNALGSIAGVQRNIKKQVRPNLYWSRKDQ